MKAILVIGMPNEQDFVSGLNRRFLERTEIILAGLVGKLGFNSGDIHVLQTDGTEGSGRRLRQELESLLLEYSKNDLCLFYTGHGQEDGWALSGKRDAEGLSYDDLGLALSCHSANLVFVNYCCFSGAAKSALEHRIGDSLLIAAMPANRSDCAYAFCRMVIEHWTSGRFFNPHASRESLDYIPVVEGNEKLQELLFKKNGGSR